MYALPKDEKKQLEIQNLISEVISISDVII